MMGTIRRGHDRGGRIGFFMIREVVRMEFLRGSCTVMV